MRKKLLEILMSALLLIGMAGAVQANTMTNFTGNGVFTSYTEDGILMTNNIGNGAWNAYMTPGSVHLDDGKVTLTMADNSLFDLNSVSFGYNNAPVNFSFSNGNSWTLAAYAAGTINFATLGIADDLQWFSIDGNTPWCTQINDIRMDPSAPVPEPSTLILLGAGLGGFAIWRRKQKS